MKLLFHLCCANCAIYPVERLRASGIDYTGFWFNPNIHPSEEYTLRLESLKRLSEEWRFQVVYHNFYDPALFFVSISGMREPPERCAKCYQLRLEETAIKAKQYGFDAFGTSLLVSPYQKFELIVDIGRKLAERYNIEFYTEDFRPGYRDAMQISRQLGLYRQKYCGCIYSEAERNRRNSHHKKS